MTGARADSSRSEDDEPRGVSGDSRRSISLSKPVRTNRVSLRKPNVGVVDLTKPGPRQGGAVESTEGHALATGGATAAQGANDGPGEAPRSGTIPSSRLPHTQPAPGTQAEPPSGGSPRGRNRRALVAATAVCLAAAGAVALWASRDHGPTAQAGESTEVSTSSGLEGTSVTSGAVSSSSATTSPSTSVSASSTSDVASSTSQSTSSTSTHAPTKNPAHEALVTLRSTAKSDTARVHRDGHWVAMLAGKRAGLKDPLDPPPTGTKWTWPAIEAQHERLRNDPRFSGRVRLILSTSFGRAITDGHGKPYFVTFYNGDFSSPDAVQSWCKATFSDISGDVLADRCAPAQLSKPH